MGALCAKYRALDFDKMLAFKTAKVVVVEDKYVGGVSVIGYSLVLIYMFYIMLVGKVYVSCVPPGARVTSIQGRFLGTTYSALSNEDCETLGLSRNDSDFIMHSYLSSKTDACVTKQYASCTTLIDDCMWYPDVKLCFESSEQLTVELFVAKGALSVAEVEGNINALFVKLGFAPGNVNVTVMTQREYSMSAYAFDPLNVVAMKPDHYAVCVEGASPVKGLTVLNQYKLQSSQVLIDVLQTATNLTVSWFGRLKFTYEAAITGVSEQVLLLDYTGIKGTFTTTATTSATTSDVVFSPNKKEGGFGKGNYDRLLNKMLFSDTKGSAGIMYINPVWPADSAYTLMEQSQIDGASIRLGESISVEYSKDSQYIFNLFTNMNDYFLEFDLAIINTMYMAATDEDKPHYGGSMHNTHLRLLDPSGGIVNGCTRYGIDIEHTSSVNTCALQAVACSSDVGSDSMSIPIGSFLHSAGARLGMTLSELGQDAVDTCIEVVQKLYGFNDKASFEQLRLLGFLDILEANTVGGGYDKVVNATIKFCHEVSWELLGGTLTVNVEINNMPQEGTYLFSKDVSGGPYQEDFVNVDMTATFELGEGRFPGLNILFVHNGNICQFTFQQLLVQITAAVTLFASAALLTELVLRVRQKDVYEKKFQRERIQRNTVFPEHNQKLAAEIDKANDKIAMAEERADKADAEIQDLKRLITKQNSTMNMNMNMHESVESKTNILPSDEATLLIVK